MSKTSPIRTDVNQDMSYQWDNPGVLYDRYGHSVNTVGDIWVLTDPTLTTKCNFRNINNDRNNIEALKAYIGYCVEVKAAHTATNMHKFFKQASMIDSFRNYPLSLMDLISVLESFRRNDFEWAFHWIRKWYIWCADVEITGFYQSVADELLEYSIEGNEKGVAVLTDDDEEGPLDNVEYDLLRAVVNNGVGSDIERVCIMLCMELGANPKSFVLLEERDFFKRETKSGDIFCSLHVPRIKKRLSSRSVKPRRVSKYLGRAIEELVLSNKSACAGGVSGKNPLLRRWKRRDLPTKSLSRFEWHLTTTDFSQLVIGYAKKANIVSHRTGYLLHLSPRRLRYTFATRLVEQGASPAIVADALDHTDLQHVGVYYKARGKTVEALDKALECNPHYIDIISRFCGTVVDRGETVGLPSIPGTTPTYRFLGGIGGCGAKSLCKVYPPLSCYLCPSFQAWTDGPHQGMLDELQAYARKVAAVSGYPGPRIANQVDDVILAISQLINRINEGR